MVGLTHVNSVNDLRRTIVKFFPTITGFWRYSRDKDKFLYEKEWKEAALGIFRLSGVDRQLPRLQGHQDKCRENTSPDRVGSPRDSQ